MTAHTIDHTIDKTTGAMYIYFRRLDTKNEEYVARCKSQDVQVIADFDTAGSVIGLELLLTDEETINGIPSPFDVSKKP